jgi:hypothetical protein
MYPDAVAAVPGVMLPKFRGLGTPNEKTVAMSAEAAMEPVIDCALAREGTAMRPSAAMRRRERFTRDSWRGGRAVG